MDFLKAGELGGRNISMRRLHDRHFDIGGKIPGQKNEQNGFRSMLLDALNQTNNLQKAEEDIKTQMLTDPDSVSAHDVTIAMAKARMSLSITKSVVDKAVSAYREIGRMQ